MATSQCCLMPLWGLARAGACACACARCKVGSLSERAISLAISLGGVLVTAILLGLISDAIGEYMDGLREGRSDVVEAGHTLILGRSDKLCQVIWQVALANDSEGGGVVVVLADDGEKNEVEAEVAELEEERGGLRGTRVVVRTGSPLVPADLRKVRLAAALGSSAWQQRMGGCCRCGSANSTSESHTQAPKQNFSEKERKREREKERK